MKKTEKEAVAELRKAMGLRRLDPRRLYRVCDGAMTWIGDRAKLTRRDAADLRAIHASATRPDRVSPETRARVDACDYDALCNRNRALAATYGGSCDCMDLDDLPEDWQDGGALGPLAPL